MVYCRRALRWQDTPMILFVDDNPENCLPFAIYLKRRGYPVECVEGGAAALELVRTRTPTLIVLDEMMPGMTGRETLAELRRRPELAETPVVFFTGSTMDPGDVGDPHVVGFFRKASLDVVEMCETLQEAYRAELERRAGGGEDRQA